ncbi:MAG: hypothetical protein JXQ72_10610, partial [Anaerolineae bacterium]|nr:hypothetical protein [Anaerolineae bacterium]
MRHTRTGYGLILSILIVIGIAASAAWAGGAALANQQTTPTPGFGPIITPGTGPTSEATPVPATPTPPPTNTAVPTITPTDAPTQTPTIAGTPLPTLRADLMGIQINPNLTEDDFNFMLWLAERLGVKWIKFQFAWEILEPQQGTLSNDFFA